MEEYVDGQVSDVKNGLDDKASKTELKETGIDVEAGKITLTADKTVFQDGSGNEVAMFADGKLNAGMIDAKQIVTDGLQTNTIDAKDATIQNLNVENAYVSGKIIASSGKVGYFSISDNGELWFDDGHDAAHRPMELSNTVLFFTHSTDGKTNDVINWLGSATHNNYGTYLTSDYWLDDQQSSPTKSKVGLLLSVENGTTNQSDAMGNVSGNFAIYAVKGMMAASAPPSGASSIVRRWTCATIPSYASINRK